MTRARVTVDVELTAKRDIAQVANLVRDSLTAPGHWATRDVMTAKVVAVHLAVNFEPTQADDRPPVGN
jgi:hypothetical protein